MATQPNRSDGGQQRGWGAWLRRRLGWGGNPPPDTPDERSRRVRKPSKPVRQRSMERGHEPENASESIGGVLLGGALLVLSVAVVVWAIIAFAGLLGARGSGPLDEAEVTEATVSRYDVPPKPRLQIDPAIDLQALHQREYERLHEYGRVDSARLHIPIARAMRLVNRRGLPADSASGDSLNGDTLRVPTGSGFRIVSRRFPGPPRSEPFLGSSPEPYTPAPAFARRLTEDGYLPRIDSLQ